MTYFITLPDLLANPDDLLPEIKDLFPITSQKQLKFLSFYRNKLTDHYNFERLPSSFFQLSPSREHLPTTYHELNSKVRFLFLLDLSNSEYSIQEIRMMLQEFYIFKTIPNDFFKQKPWLPKDPSQIKLNTTFMYPITDDLQTKEFLQEANNKYRVRFPISENIMTANPTNKPRLPTDPQLISEYNLTTPIISSRQLIDIVKLLRQDYYFTKLLSE